jgi:rRNA-processing protein FCF1
MIQCEYALQLMQRYRSHGILVDTNILLLHFVGSFDRSLITRFKRTERFTVEDFDLLEHILARFDRVVTTPNVLSEVNSLSNQLAEPARKGYFEDFARRIVPLHEEYVISAEAARRDCFPRLGLTDSGILHLVKDKYLVLTDDFRLHGTLEKHGVDAINFNHLRRF